MSTLLPCLSLKQCIHTYLRLFNSVNVCFIIIILDHDKTLINCNFGVVYLYIINVVVIKFNNILQIAYYITSDTE